MLPCSLAVPWVPTAVTWVIRLTPSGSRGQRGLWWWATRMMSDPRAGGWPAAAGPSAASGDDGRQAAAGRLGDRLVVGSWNMSGWTAPKAETVFAAVNADILALQETHLARDPLRWQYGPLQAKGWSLFHGSPVAPASGGTFGRSCGVGFVARAGVAAAAALPVGSAWRWLHHTGRLHGLRLGPRPGLPHGLLLLSVYAPLQTRQQLVDRGKFEAALEEVSHQLDMQVPTLLLGDFKGSAVPGRDFQGETSARRPACPLLCHLLGPGGAWVDVHATLLSEPLPWTFQLLVGLGSCQPAVSIWPWLTMLP